MKRGSGMHANALDGLRGLAALMVIASHWSLLGLHLIPGFSLSGIGKYGVFLFFVLSAYLLTLQWLEFGHHALFNLAVWRTYLLRRFFRIYPSFILVLIAGVFFSSIPGIIPLKASEALEHFLLLQGKEALWSIPVEFKYYLLLPFVAAAFSRQRKNSLRILVVSGILIVCASFFFPAKDSVSNGIDLGYYLPLFFSGAALAALRAAKPEQEEKDSRAAGMVFCLAFLILFCLIPSTLERLGFNVPAGFFHRSYVLFGILWGLVLGSIGLFRCNFATKLAGSFLLRFYGRISFSLYLWHIPVGAYTASHFQKGVLSSWIGFLAATLLAWIGWYLIERPFILFASRHTRYAFQPANLLTP